MAMSATAKHSVSVAGIVVDDAGRVLVTQRRDNGRWEPPGGVLEIEEGPEEGAVREVLEETGLVVAVERLTGVYKNTSRNIIALVFRCHPLSGEVHPTDEARTAVWLPPAAAMERMSEAFAYRIADALVSAGPPVIRVHDGTHLTTQ